MVASAAETVLAGRYRLLRRIGAGGMGEVWEARDTVLERPVAVKLVGDAHRDDASVLARFEREARTGARLTHPNLGTVYDYGTADEGVYLVMELLEGETLAERLRRGPLPPEEAAEVVAQAAAALAVAHAAGVVHRDVKPSNLMLTSGGTKVMDFGIATGDGDPLTATGLVVGTAAYLAPERVQGQSAGPEADVYALGIVLHEAITGERAFSGDTPAEVAMAQIHREPPDLAGVPGVPAAVAEAGRAALAKDPARRPTAEDLVHRLRGTGRARPATTVAAPVATRTEAMPVATPPAAAPVPVPAPARPRRNGPPAWFVVIGLLLLLVAGAVGAYLLTNDDDPDPTPPGPTSPVTTAAPAPTTTPVPSSTVPVTTVPPPTTAVPTTLPPEPDPGGDEAGQAAVDYVELLDAGEFDAAWARTTPEFQAEQDRESWEGFWSIYDSVELAGDPQVEGASGRVVLPLSFDGRVEDYLLELVQAEDGTWLVDGPVGR